MNSNIETKQVVISWKLAKRVNFALSFVILLIIGRVSEEAKGAIPGEFARGDQASFGGQNSHDVRLGDLDGDGDLDAWVPNGHGAGVQRNEVWLNDGQGSFTDSGQRLGSSLSESVALGDVDLDGDLDAVVANFDLPSQPGYNRLYLNDGKGVFDKTGIRLGRGPRNSEGIAMGDLNGDGYLDIIVANSGWASGEANEVYLNDGNGKFLDTRQRLGRFYSVGIKLGDLDQDGDLDGWVTNRNGQANTVWMNDGTGTFSDSGQRLGNSESGRAELGDLDGDGDLDAVVANRNSQANRVWINDGKANFVDGGQEIGSASSNQIAIGDVDGDGDLDIVVANRGNQSNRIWLNDGAANFTATKQRLGSLSSHGVALADLNGDGGLDIWFANAGRNRVWMGVPGSPKLKLQGGILPPLSMNLFATRITLTFPTEIESIYQIEESTDLVSWEKRGGPFRGTGEIHVEDLSREVIRFYRLQQGLE